ncbi:polymerase/histidinol phosphatase-like protein [Abortiporus biennis]|nr:polymerase/histidinol phosphatase-like protein [Abortiporus biennis]
MPYSHHSHSGQFCKHAVGTLEDVVQEAIKQGFEIYGLTEHVPRYRTEDLYPEEATLSLDDLTSQFDAFLAEAHRLQALYAEQITLLVGLETEYITPLDLDKLEQLLSRSSDKVEYLVGSIHHVGGVPIDFDQNTFNKALENSPFANNMESFLNSYFDAQLELFQRFHPEVIGHFDLCKLYNPSLSFASFPSAWEKAKRNIRYAVDYGALFELNAAALRKGWSSSYPAIDIVQVIQEYGGRFTLSDDSHGPHAVGLNYHRMADYMRHAEINELWVLERSKTKNIGGRYVHARKVEGDWRGHKFWTKGCS